MKKKLVLIAGIVVVVLLSIAGLEFFRYNSFFVNARVLKFSLYHIYSSLNQYHDSYGELPNNWEALIKHSALNISMIYSRYSEKRILGEKELYDPVFYFYRSTPINPSDGRRILLAFPHETNGKRGVILFDGHFHPDPEITYLEGKEFRRYLTSQSAPE